MRHDGLFDRLSAPRFMFKQAIAIPAEHKRRKRRLSLFLEAIRANGQDAVEAEIISSLQRGQMPSQEDRVIVATMGLKPSPSGETFRNCLCLRWQLTPASDQSSFTV